MVVSLITEIDINMLESFIENKAINITRHDVALVVAVRILYYSQICPQNMTFHCK